MKKFLFVLAIGAFATACNDNTENSSTTTDSVPAATVPVDTSSSMAPMDTTSRMMDTTTSKMADSSSKK